MYLRTQASDEANSHPFLVWTTSSNYYTHLPELHLTAIQVLKIMASREIQIPENMRTKYDALLSSYDRRI